MDKKTFLFLYPLVWQSMRAWMLKGLSFASVSAACCKSMEWQLWGTKYTSWTRNRTHAQQRQRWQKTLTALDRLRDSIEQLTVSVGQLRHHTKTEEVRLVGRGIAHQRSSVQVAILALSETNNSDMTKPESNKHVRLGSAWLKSDIIFQTFQVVGHGRSLSLPLSFSFWSYSLLISFSKQKFNRSTCWPLERSSHASTRNVRIFAIAFSIFLVS